MSFNLLRNSRVFFTTAVGDTGSALGVIGGALAVGGNAVISNTNTREIQVLDGFGFSQNTTSETVTLNESGATPVRGQRTFNTQLDPVDFNMTTYMRPYKDSTTTKAEEGVLWNALFSAGTINGASGAWKDGTYDNPAEVTLDNSDKHQLQKFGLIIVMDSTAFVIDDCVLNTATIDFGIDAIASVAWAGQAKGIRQYAAPSFVSGVSTGTMTGSISGVFSNKVTTAPFIANKLSVCSVEAQISPGSIGSVSVSAGSGYTSAPTVAFAAPFTATAFSSGGTVALNDYISSAGNYYKVIDVTGTAPYTLGASAPTHLSGVETSNEAELEWVGRIATGTATISGGGVAGVAITDSGAGYTSAPAITLSGGGGSGGAATATLSSSYSVPLTGGNLTISNNISYLTPAILGTVNQPATYFTGTRAVSGSLTAYLRTGTGTGSLMSALLASKDTDVAPAYNINIKVGGTTGTYVEFDIPAGVLQIPTIATEQVVSTTINFTAAGSTAGSFDIAKANELNIKYYAS